MLTTKRHKMILEELNKNGSVQVSSLVEILNTSESTIRRDLNALDKQGKLKKIHGGATLEINDFKSEDDDVDLRMNMNIDEKRLIAKEAASYIKENDFVYIDAGTTTDLLIDYINVDNASYVTNGISQAQKLAKKGFDVYILGGELKVSTQAIIGVEAISSLQKYNFTKGFFGTNGLSIEKGYMTPDLKEALVKKEAIRRTSNAYMLVDSSKFDRNSNVTFSNIEDAKIITIDEFNNHKEVIKEETEVIEVKRI